METNAQHQQNLSHFTMSYLENSTSMFDEFLDQTIDGAAGGNFSEYYCPSMRPDNMTYLNVSCEPIIDFSVPLYGMLVLSHRCHV